MKKIHFISLSDCYRSLSDKSGCQIFIDLVEIIPKTSRFYVGPLFSTTTEALEISAEGFKLFLEKDLVDTANGAGPLFDIRLGSDSLLDSLVPQAVREEGLSSFYWWNEVKAQIGDYAEFLSGAKKSINALFEKMNQDEQCLVFIVFPFGEIICQEFLATRGKTPVFEFLKGFSLSEDNSVELL